MKKKKTKKNKKKKFQTIQEKKTKYKQNEKKSILKHSNLLTQLNGTKKWIIWVKFTKMFIINMTSDSKRKNHFI